MPFLRLDEDGFEEGEDDEVTYTGDFKYYPAEDYAYKPEPYDPAKLPAVAKAALDALVSLGITQFRVRYDGGHDEGFAHADCGRTADGAVRSVDELVAGLALPERIAGLRAAAGGESASRWHNSADRYAKLQDATVVRDALYELGNEMASCLLGNGYGTGEYSMYGAITADLVTGELTDERDSVPRPPDSTFD